MLGGGREEEEKEKRMDPGLNNAPRVYPSSDSSCVSLDFRQQRESAFANFLSPLSASNPRGCQKEQVDF